MEVSTWRCVQTSKIPHVTQCTPRYWCTTVRSYHSHYRYVLYLYIYINLHCLLPSAHYPLLKLTLSLWSSQMEGRGHAIETVLNMLYHISSLSLVKSLLGSIPEYLYIII